LTVVNSFGHRTVATFPSEPLSFLVFALLTDGLGEARVDVTISRIDTEEMIYQRSLNYRFRYPLETLRFSLRVRDCSFPVPGRYQAAVLADGEMIAERVLVIHQREGVS
jgi:hypothetical protein